MAKLSHKIPNFQLEIPSSMMMVEMTCPILMNQQQQQRYIEHNSNAKNVKTEQQQQKRTIKSMGKFAVSASIRLQFKLIPNHCYLMIHSGHIESTPTAPSPLLLSQPLIDQIAPAGIPWVHRMDTHIRNRHSSGDGGSGFIFGNMHFLSIVNCPMSLSYLYSIMAFHDKRQS